jgi:hypothetical protein
VIVVRAAVGGYLLDGHDGVYLLLDPETRETKGAVVSAGGGLYRVRLPAGGVAEVTVPEGERRPGLWAAERAMGDGADPGPGDLGKRVAGLLTLEG